MTDIICSLFIKRSHDELRHTIGFEFIYISFLMHDENVEFVNFLVWKED